MKIISKTLKINVYKLQEKISKYFLNSHQGSTKSISIRIVEQNEAEYPQFASDDTVTIKVISISDCLQSVVMLFLKSYKRKQLCILSPFRVRNLNRALKDLMTWIIDIRMFTFAGVLYTKCACCYDCKKSNFMTKVRG